MMPSLRITKAQPRKFRKACRFQGRIPGFKVSGGANELENLKSVCVYYHSISIYIYIYITINSNVIYITILSPLIQYCIEKSYWFYFILFIYFFFIFFFWGGGGVGGVGGGWGGGGGGGAVRPL